MTETNTDPVVALSALRDAALRRVNAAHDDEEVNARRDIATAIEKQIAETPATTAAGLAAKLKVFADHGNIGKDDYLSGDTFRSALADVERLAGSAPGDAACPDASLAALLLGTNDDRGQAHSAIGGGRIQELAGEFAILGMPLPLGVGDELWDHLDDHMGAAAIGLGVIPSSTLQDVVRKLDTLVARMRVVLEPKHEAEVVDYLLATSARDDLMTLILHQRATDALGRKKAAA
ncbi:MAG: hypothetical protein H7840_14640 [Alphaproteobacteria bacterium]